MPVAMRITAIDAVAQANRRTASELPRISWRREKISKPANRLDDVDPELLADAADEDLDRIRIAIEILVVEVLDELGARDHPTGMMHQIGEQAILVRGQLHRVAVHADPAGTGVEPHRAAIELALGVSGGPAQERAD